MAMGGRTRLLQTVDTTGVSILYFALSCFKPFLVASFCNLLFIVAMAILAPV